MKKRWLFAKDTDYFNDSEDAIKLVSCPEGGGNCRLQMQVMNKSLLLARQFIENKEYTRALSFIGDAFESTLELNEKRCEACASLFRDSITNSLNHLVHDLEEMTTGIFAKKSYKSDLKAALGMLQEIKDKLNGNEQP